MRQSVNVRPENNYVSVLVEVSHIAPKMIPRRVVGIDLGIKDVIITSDGEKIKTRKL